MCGRKPAGSCCLLYAHFYDWTFFRFLCVLTEDWIGSQSAEEWQVQPHNINNIDSLTEPKLESNVLYKHMGTFPLYILTHVKSMDYSRFKIKQITIVIHPCPKTIFFSSKTWIWLDFPSEGIHKCPKKGFPSQIWSQTTAMNTHSPLPPSEWCWRICTETRFDSKTHFCCYLRTCADSFPASYKEPNNKWPRTDQL